MRLLNLPLAVWLVAGSLVATGSVFAADSADEVARLLLQDTLSDGERYRLELQLKEIAGGPVDAPETLAGTIGLARYRLHRPTSASNRQIISEWLALVSQAPAEAAQLGILPALAERQLEIDDVYGAYTTFSRIYIHSGFADPDLAARAAQTAADANELRAALLWSQSALGQVDDAAAMELHRVRLEASWALGQPTVATAALARLEQEAPGRLRLWPGALLAAARLRTSLGELDAAADLYEVFANVHDTDPRHSEALYELARIHTRQARHDLARLTLDWLVQAHPSSREAGVARIERLELDGRNMEVRDIAEYVDTARDLIDGAMIERVLGRMLERLIAAGHATEGWGAVVRLARENSTLSPAARRAAPAYLDQVLALLASREDDTGALAVVLTAEAIEIPIPDEHAAWASRLRGQFGFDAQSDDYRTRAIEVARAELRRGICGESAERLTLIFRRNVATTVPRPEVEAAAAAVWAECAWREGWDGDPVALLRRVRQRELPEIDRRQLLLVEAALLFESDRQTSCALYRSAKRIAAADWIERLLERCDPDEVAAPEEVRVAQNGD